MRVEEAPKEKWKQNIFLEADAHPWERKSRLGSKCKMKFITGLQDYECQILEDRTNSVHEPMRPDMPSRMRAGGQLPHQCVSVPFSVNNHAIGGIAYTRLGQCHLTITVSAQEHGLLQQADAWNHFLMMYATLRWYRIVIHMWMPGN